MSGAAADDDRDLQAAEYVMGGLAPAQARAMEALALSDPGVAASIAAWEVRLAPLVDTVAPLMPPSALWRRLSLAAGIDDAGDQVAALPPMPRRGGRAWRNAGLWRTATAASMAVAASLGFLLYTGSARAPIPLVAALSPQSGPGATFLVRVGPDGIATVVAVNAPNVPAGRSLELWAVSTGAPVSLGLLPESGRVRLPLNFPAGTKLLVSQEPAGGSLTKQPTGPVVFGGELTGI